MSTIFQMFQCPQPLKLPKFLGDQLVSPKEGPDEVPMHIHGFYWCYLGKWQIL